MKTTIALMYGGKSVEHEVSIISGIQALANIDRELYEVIPVYLDKNNNMYIGDDIGNIEAYKDTVALIKRSQRVIMVRNEDGVKLVSYPMKRFAKAINVSIDIAFPIVHGTNVEDGALQGYFKTIGIPFVGCDVTSSAVGMDKYAMKCILKCNSIPVLDCLHYSKENYKKINVMVGEIENRLGYPVIVKPVNLGSSVGISVAKNTSELIKAIDTAYSYANRILVERAIANLREINCAVLGDSEDAIASECEEPIHTDSILSYEDKYINNSKGASKGMASVQRIIPADLSDYMRDKVRDTAVNAFKCLDCNGVARIDFMIDMDNEELFLNEINTIPGSLSYYLWEPTGIPYKQLLDKMIKLALKRVRDEESIMYTFDTNILNQKSLSGLKGVKK